MTNILTFLLDLIFPKFCVSCNIEGTWLCKKCYSEIQIKDKQCCPICRKINDGSVCFDCKKLSPLDGLIVSTNYTDKLIKELIHLYKYQYIKSLYLPLACLLHKTIKKPETGIKKIFNNDTIIFAIPLHKKRYLERGYNQSDLLTEYIAKKNNLAYYKKLIRRIKNTDIQAKLSKKDRYLNLKSAFTISNKFDFYGKNVIIIDDVATTLATLNSCASLLKNAGANQVWGLVIARGN